jgi:hypothetical protein
MELPAAAAARRREAKWASVVALVLACLIFSGLSVYLAYTSESDLEADATTHFLMARYAPHERHYFASVWGRPLCTGVYALTAHLGTVEEGRRYTRFLSLGLALACAGVTYAIGKRQGFRRPALVVILLLAQPLFFLHSFSELTEIPFALLLMIGFLAYQRRQWFVMALCISVLPLGRPEGFGFILMAATALIAHRRWRWLWVLPAPFIVWNYAGWFLTTVTPHEVRWYWWFFNGDWWRWVLRNWPYSYQSTYGSGPLLSYVARLPVLTSPGFFPFMLIGFALAIRWLWPHRNRAHLADEPAEGESWLLGLTHLERCEILIALIPLSILIVHSVLWWKGKMGSNGELRYLLIVGPFIALLGARGWEWAWATLRWRAPMFVAGGIALAPISVNSFYRVVPFPLYADGVVSREAADWYGSDHRVQRDFPRIMPTPPQVFYFMDISQTDSRRAMGASRLTVTQPPLGAVLIWDPIYGPHNSSADMCVDLDMIEANEVYLSPKTINGEDARKTYTDTFDSLFNLQRLGE